MFAIRTLGVLDVRSDDGACIQSILAQPKRAALLCYLAAGAGSHHSRDALVAMFWPELDAAHARNALSQAVHFLRRSLGRDAILNRNSDDLAVNRELIHCDAVELVRLLERDALERALSLYQGDFLNGFYVADAPAFERWVEDERARLRELSARAAAALTQHWRAQGEWSAALACARRSCTLAPYDEARARDLIELLVQAGQLPTAIEFYESFQRRLWDELELRPSAETRALIQSPRGHSSAPVPSGKPHSDGDSTDALDVLRNELAPDLEVSRLLGRGSTALAYLAREPALKRLVTVKVLRRHLATDFVARQRFEREAQAAARISHTNVATVYRVGRLHNGCPYIVMEYVDGRTLADTIAARGPLPQEEVRVVLAALASALAAAHQNGVIHRDVRPSSIFIENRSGRVVLADFGIAALLESGTEEARRLTPAGTPLGELRYVSPEQARGATVTELSDMYAFGIVAFEALTGMHPSMTGPRAAADPPSDLVRMVERCLAQEASQRPRAQDVARVLAGSGTR